MTVTLKAITKRLYTRWQFEPFLSRGLVDLVQPDIGTAGGITETAAICRAAHEYGKSAQLHTCGTPLLKAATLNVEAVLPNAVIHEHHVNYLHDYNRRLCVCDYQPVNGVIAVPDGPGLGNEISRFAPEHSTHVVVR